MKLSSVTKIKERSKKEMKLVGDIHEVWKESRTGFFWKIKKIKGVVLFTAFWVDENKKMEET